VLAADTDVIAVAGDVAAPSHREKLVEAAQRLGGLDLLVNNASILGPSPQPTLADYDLDDLRAVYEVNVVAPLALTQLALPLLRQSGGVVINVTSDAGVEGYEGWGGYGSSKAALEQVSRVLAAEESALAVYWVDPGDMRTQMHQEAFPGEDISDRPRPEDSVPGLLELIATRPASGRYSAKAVMAP
jgi:NAD(P)-dependent dehydrogenase (short-subunit alcohol dehydrogenase family)